MLENLDPVTERTALVPRILIFGNPERALPKISPDGRTLAYLAPHEGILNVWVRTVGQSDDRVVTSDAKRGIRDYFWQEDSRHILYLQDQDGDENWHLHQTSLESRLTRDLTPFSGIQAQMVATDPDFPDEILIGLNLSDPRLHDVYRIHLKNGTVDLDTKNPGDVVGWSADNRMRVRACEAVSPDGGTVIRVRDDAESPKGWRDLLSWGAEETLGGVVAFSPDDAKLYVLTSVDANAARLLELDLASGILRPICQDPIYDAGSILTHPKSREIQAVEFVRARREWEILDPDLKQDFELLAGNREGDFTVSSRDNEDLLWVVTYVHDDAPPSYYLYHRRSRKAEFLFSSRPSLERFKLAKMTPISFQARDGLEIHGYLTLPPDLPPRGLPLVLFVHGGPWARDVWGYHPEVQWMANRGYAVLQVNYRGSTGYGKRFLSAGNREWGGKMQADLEDAVAWAVREGPADPGKVAIYGGSYGGYATLVGVTFTPELFACAVDIVGPSNLLTFIQSIPPYWAPYRAALDFRVGKLETEEEFLKSRSPLFKAEAIRIPLLIAQGANDPRVKKAESDQIVSELRKKKLPVLYLVFPDEGHGFARPENRLKFYAAAESFLAEHLGGRLEAAGPEEDFRALLQ